MIPLRSQVWYAQCNIRSKNFPDAGIKCVYAIGKYSQSYGEIVSCFRHLAKEIILEPNITQKDFVISNNYPDGSPGFNFFYF